MAARLHEFSHTCSLPYYKTFMVLSKSIIIMNYKEKQQSMGSWFGNYLSTNTNKVALKCFTISVQLSLKILSPLLWDNANDFMLLGKYKNSIWSVKGLWYSTVKLKQLVLDLIAAHIPLTSKHIISRSMAKLAICQAITDWEKNQTVMDFTHTLLSSLLMALMVLEKSTPHVRKKKIRKY